MLSRFGDIWIGCTYIYTSDWSGSCSEEGPLFGERAPLPPICGILIGGGMPAPCCSFVVVVGNGGLVALFVFNPPKQSAPPLPPRPVTSFVRRASSIFPPSRIIQELFSPRSGIVAKVAHVPVPEPGAVLSVWGQEIYIFLFSFF